MTHYIEPQDSNREPINNKRIKVWYVMILGAVVATSESLDIAKRMAIFLDEHEIHKQNKMISDDEIEEMIFYKANLKTHIYSTIPRLFMKMQHDWSETPNKITPPINSQPTQNNKI